MITDNILKIDLRKSKDVLIDTFRKMNFDPQTAIHDKEEFDVLFFKLVDNEFHQFAFIRKGQKGIEFMKSYYVALSKLESSTADDIICEPNTPVQLDLDAILDKILEKGIESLTDIELQQLDAFAGVAPQNTNEFNLHANHSSKIDNHNKRSNGDSESNLAKEKEVDSEELKTFMNIANAMMKDSPRNKRRWVNKYKNHPFYAIVAGVINGKYDAEEMEKRIMKFLKKRNN